MARTARTSARASTRPTRAVGDAAAEAGRGAGARQHRTGRGRRPRREVHPGVFRRRRVTALVVAVLVLAGLSIGGRALVYDAGLFDVEGVSVTGTVTLSPEEVIATAAVPHGAPLAEIDTARIAARVATLPAVATAAVERSWPHTVAIEIVERVPVGVVSNGGEDALVDATGAVYAGVPAPDLPRFAFAGVGPDDPATLAAVAALAALPAEVRSQVRAVEAARGAGSPQITFELTEGRRVRWGSPDRAAAKAAVLVPLLTQPGRVFDVASPDLPTVRR